MRTHAADFKRLLEKRVAHLESALRKYGDHLSDCPCRHGKLNGCECGYHVLKIKPEPQQ